MELKQQLTTARIAVAVLLLSGTGCRISQSDTSTATLPDDASPWTELTHSARQSTSKIVSPITSGFKQAQVKLRGDREPDSSLENGKTKGADDVLSLANTPSAPSAKLLTAAGNLAEEQRDFSRAQHNYLQALQQQPDYLAAHLSLGRLHQSQGHLPLAIEQYQAALKYHPLEPGLNNDLGLALLESNQVTAAIVSLEAAVAANPEEVRYRNNLARALVKKGEAEQAVTVLAQLLGRATALYNVGYLLTEAGQQTAAVPFLQQALELDPLLEPARQALAQLTTQTSSQIRR